MRRDARASLNAAVRASWVGRRTSRLRTASPRLYAALRWVYRGTIDRGKGDLSPYQQRAVTALLESASPELLARGVLEIGTDVDVLVPRALLANGTSRVTGLNPVLDNAVIASVETASPGICLLPIDLLGAALPPESFGAIFSVAVFEHLLEFDRCLDEMYRLLVPGGVVVASFGPIWSSSLGHHVFADAGQVKLRHWDPRLNPVPDHGHLLLDRAALHDAVTRKVGAAAADAAVAWILDGSEINRLFYEDFTAAFERSSLELVRLEPERESVPAARLRELKASHPGRQTFDVRNALVVLRKPN